MQKPSSQDLILVRTFWRLSDDVREVLGRILVDGGEKTKQNLVVSCGDSIKCELYFPLVEIKKRPDVSRKSVVFYCGRLYRENALRQADSSFCSRPKFVFNVGVTHVAVPTRFIHCASSHKIRAIDVAKSDIRSKVTLPAGSITATTSMLQPRNLTIGGTLREISCPTSLDLYCASE